MEKINLPQKLKEFKEKLKEISKEPFNVLLLEDNQLIIDTTVNFLNRYFKLATVEIINNNQWPNIEEIIRAGNFKLFILDNHLKNWQIHEKYNNSGFKLIRFIKMQNPDTLVLAVTLHQYDSEAGIYEGADMGLRKADFHQLL